LRSCANVEEFIRGTRGPARVRRGSPVSEKSDATFVGVAEDRTGWLPNRWYGILFSGDLGSKPKKVKRFGLELVLFRDSKGNANCLVDVCPHRGVALSAGKIVGDNLVCPYHGFQFDGRGACNKIPCNPPKKQIPSVMRAGHFTVREMHGVVWLWWGDVIDAAELPALPWFHDIEVKPQFSSQVSFDWSSSFKKTVEAMFDHHHAPILHGSGRGSLGRQTEAHEFQVHVEGEVLRLTGRLQEPTSDGAFNPKGYDLEAKVMLPGLSYIAIGRYIRILAVDCPIDEASTHRLIIYLNRFLEVPILGKIAMFLFRVVDVWKLQRSEDEPVVRTMDRCPDFPERLVGADIAIGQLRKQRSLLMEAELKNASHLPFWVRRQLRGTPAVSSIASRRSGY
jgi:nitrite reductase/ring-hydroxylating ferredoxin subunit